jgi:hypothetical protein
MKKARTLFFLFGWTLLLGLQPGQHLIALGHSPLKNASDKSAFTTNPLGNLTTKPSGHIVESGKLIDPKFFGKRRHFFNTPGLPASLYSVDFRIGNTKKLFCVLPDNYLEHFMLTDQSRGPPCSGSSCSL